MGNNFMASFLSARKFATVVLLAVTPYLVRGQGSYIPQGGEYNIGGTLVGDQVYPGVSLSSAGGYLVWQDNATDGSGFGISARKLDSNLSATLSNFRVNQIGAADQERAQVSMLNDGGAWFVWQGGPQGFQHIYARLLASAGTWTTDDVMVSAATNVYQLESAVTTMTNGYSVVAWSSFNQVSATSMRDVYFQILSPTGTKFGGETRANQATAFNQRSAALAALSDGRFVAVWISEQQRYENSVDVYGRIFTSSGAAVGSEFLINTGTNVCSNPSVAPSPDGGFAVAWTENDSQNITNGWDVYVRPFNGSAGGGVMRQVNSYLKSNQLGPKIAAQGNNYFVVWTSQGQDSSREGVYGQFLNSDGSLLGDEIRVNSTTVSQQLYPALASDGAARLLPVWSSFVGGVASFDLYAQRYVNTNQSLSAPGAPYVNVLNSSSLAVTWPPVLGFSIANYEVYADGAATATAVVTNTYWTMTNLAAGSAHSFRLAYVLADARRSPLSAPANGTTYVYPFSYSGIPYDWMYQMFGSEIINWPLGSVDSDLDGASNLQEYLQGTDPNDPNSVLRYSLRATEQGVFLDWNTQPGLIYQVQASVLPGAPWVDVGGPRFAAGSGDSMYVGGASAGFYRIGRVR